MKNFMGKLAKILEIGFRGRYQKEQKVLEQSGVKGQGLKSHIKIGYSFIEGVKSKLPNCYPVDILGWQLSEFLGRANFV